MSNERYVTGLHTFLNAKATTGTGTALKVSDFKHIVVTIATDGGADSALTVKCQGAISDVDENGLIEPAWASAQSVSNMWDYIAMYDYENAEITDGDTGFVTATADDYRQFLVNVDGIDWVNFRVTARTEGEVTVKGKAYSNL